MKKLQLFSLLLLISLSATSQQRYADLTTKLLQPKIGDTIYTDDQFAISLMAYNLGPDTVRFTDSMGLGLIFDGSPILFYVDSLTTLPYLSMDGLQIVPGDSIPINFTFTISQGWPTGATSFCVSMTPFNTADSISDTANANDLSCATIKIMDQPVGVSSVKPGGSNAAILYPNPAEMVVYAELSMANAGIVNIKVQDMQGRVVLQEDKGILSKGNHTISVNTAGLSPGLYLYRIMAGSDLTMGRLQIK